MAESTRAPRRRKGESYTKYIKPLHKQIATNKLDAKAIEALSPEVQTAKEIVIPSIISPSDMRDGEITLVSTSSKATADENAKIAEVLNAYFNNELKLSEKLPEWIHEGLYGAGSKPIMVLPVTELDDIINDPSAVITTTKLYAANESLDARTVISIEDRIKKHTQQSIFGIADQTVPVIKRQKDTTLDDLKPAIESLVETQLAQLVETDVPLKDAKRPYDLNKLWSPGTNTALENFYTTAVESLKIVDNPDLLKADRARKSTKSAEISAQIVKIYKTQPVITVNPESKPSVDHPIVIELPPESVIPIFTPGTPEDHIGYFVLLDSFGNPVRVSGDGPLIDMTDNRQVTPAGLYKAFGIEDHYSLGGQTKDGQTALMMDVYQTIVEAHLKLRLKNSGLDNIYIGAPSSVYRFMFAQYLSLRKTQLLFVPKDLMAYLSFRYNDNGTGRSRLEDIKFILSLKITIMISRVIASMNASLNRRKININFDEFPGDPVQFMQTVEKEYIDKQMTNFTYDPVEVTRTIAQRSLTVAPTNLPGLKGFEITHEPNESRTIKPDDGLREDLNNMMILGLDVPPSAYNQLGDNEFSRSIATNNLFFSRRISAYQKPVCKHVARYVQIYVRMSAPLKDKIREILKSSDKDDNTASEAKSSSTSVDSAEAKLADVIANITATLPTPNIAPNKTEFEEFDAIIGSIGQAIDAMIDDNLGDPNNENPIPTIRSLIKSDIIRSWMSKIGASRDVEIPDMADPDFVKRLAEFRLNMANLASVLKHTKDVTTPPPPIDAGLPPSGGQQPF